MIEIDLRKWVIKFKELGSEKFYQVLVQFANSRIVEEEEFRKAEAEKKLSNNAITVQKQASSVSSGTKTVSFTSFKKTFKSDIIKVSPEVDLLKYSNHFAQLYRKERVELYRDIAFCFKRAANKAYRLMIAKNMINKSDKFLNVVR